MAHPEQMLFVDQCRRFFPEWFVKKRVLEIGSLKVEGLCALFSECEYVGAHITRWIGLWQGKYPKLVDWVEANIGKTLTFYRFPRAQRSAAGHLPKSRPGQFYQDKC